VGMWWWLGVGAVVWGRGDVTCRKASQTSVGLQETARGAEVVDTLSAACDMCFVSERCFASDACDGTWPSAQACMMWLEASVSQLQLPHVCGCCCRSDTVCRLCNLGVHAVAGGGETGQEHPTWLSQEPLASRPFLAETMVSDLSTFTHSC
jgi:hypothetical protein